MTHQKRCYKQPSWYGSMILGLVIILLLPFEGYSQNWSIPYYFYDDVKQYSTEMVPNNTTGTHESAMAGTVHFSEDVTKAHFLRFDDQGLVIPGTSTIYTNNFSNVDIDTAYMHVVDLAVADSSGHNRYYITCLTRDHSANAISVTSPYPGTIQKDKITVIVVDDNGAIIDTRDFTDNKTWSGYSGGNLYPTHSLYEPSNKTLYICGYYTWLDYTILPGKPDYATEKRAFVMAIDVDAGGSNFLNRSTPPVCMSYDYIVGTCPNVANGYYDFDIAMRMKMVTKGGGTPPNNHLFVTGSVNGQQPATSYYRSAVMNLVIDPAPTGANALVPVPNFDQPILSNVNPEARGEDEYGIDLAEDKDEYIIGNKFTIGESHPNGYYGFDPRPSKMFVCKVDKSTFTMPGPNAKWYFAGGMSGAALQVLPNKPSSTFLGSQTPSLTSRFAVAGIQTNFTQGSGCNTPTYWPDVSNVSAFVTDIFVDYGATYGGGTYDRVKADYWTIYTNNSGTGNVNTDWNNYHFMGGGIANIAWNPTFAGCVNGNNDVVLNAPKFGASPLSGSSNILGIKWIRGVNSATTPHYDLPSYFRCTTEVCNPIFYEEDVVHAAPRDLEDLLTIVVSGPYVTSTSYATPDEYICETPNGDPDNKPTRVPTTKQLRTTKIYPNPATNEIHVELAKNIQSDAKVEVRLFNLYGQLISTLYKGSAVSLTPNTKLQLPDVASGLYMVHITANEKTVVQQKLTIQ